MPITKEEIEAIVRNNEDKIHEIRQNIENFRISVQAGVLDGELILGDLYGKFKRMEPCLHRHCLDDRTIDTSALIYSLQRLPKEITKTSKIYVQKEPETTNNLKGVERLHALRRRAVYDLGDGELEFIAREGETDIFDIVTCLVMYGIESEKIKKKLVGKDILGRYKTLDLGTNQAHRNQFFAKLSNALNIKLEELTNLDISLGNKLPFILENIVSHEPAKIAVRFDSEFSRTDASLKARKWTERIAKELEKYGERPLSIISSDTHSVVNCLTGFAIENKDRIFKIIAEDKSFNTIMTNDFSFLYYLVQKLCKAPEHHSLLEEKIAYEKALGIKLIRDEFETGVDVHIIDLDKILEHYNKIDKRIKFDLDKARKKGLVILNMDYSFGRQGAHNMRELCEILGKRIDSISLTGKAGLTCIHKGGQRFDLMLPTYIVPQIVGGAYDFPTGNSLRKEDFKGLIKEERIHTGGPMLTVPGTAMQSDLLFYYYIAKDNILGVEMEAGPYLDAIEKAYRRGQLKKDIMTNVGYWASDVPLDPEASLAEEHHKQGFIPSYALILATLNKVLNR